MIDKHNTGVLILHMDLRHYDHDGRARFVTTNIHHHIQAFTNDPFRLIALNAIANCCRQNLIKLLAWVIMPEHLHLVVVPPIEMKLGRAIGNLKSEIAHEILRSMRAVENPLLGNFSVIRNGQYRSSLWVRRCYDRNCRTDEEVREKINYSHNNPVKRKLVQTPEEWQWSSCRWYLGYTDALLNLDTMELRADLCEKV